MHPLESRLILGAPLALGSEGLVLASPSAPEDILGVEAAAPAATLATPAPLAPAEDPLSPVGDPEKGGGEGDGSFSLLSSSTYTVEVWMASLPDDNHGTYEFGQTTGIFRFYATACGSSGLPSSVTVNYSRTGTATPVDDYSGSLATSTSVTIPLTGTPTNKSGSAYRQFTAVDDEVDEPNPETVIATITGAADNNGNAATVRPAPQNSQQGSVTSNEYTVSKGGLGATSVAWGDPAVHRYLKFNKEGLGLNGHGYTVMSVKDTTTGEASNAITILPAVDRGGFTDHVQTHSNPDVFEDGVADISISANTDQQRQVMVRVRFDYPSDSSRPVEYFDVDFLVSVN